MPCSRSGPGRRATVRSPRRTARDDRASRRFIMAAESTFRGYRPICAEGGQAYSNIGIRYKGDATYISSARYLKRSLKIEMDDFDDAASLFHGFKKINCNAGVMDPTKAQAKGGVAYAVFRAAGVPAHAHGVCGDRTERARPLQPRMPGALHIGGAGGQAVPQEPFQERQGTAAQAAVQRAGVPGRHLGELRRPLRPPGADPGGGGPGHRVCPADQPRQQRGVWQQDRLLLLRRGRVPRTSSPPAPAG